MLQYMPWLKGKEDEKPGPIMKIMVSANNARGSAIDRIKARCKAGYAMIDLLSSVTASKCKNNFDWGRFSIAGSTKDIKVA